MFFLGFNISILFSPLKKDRRQTQLPIIGFFLHILAHIENHAYLSYCDLAAGSKTPNHS